jgi:hypothetical protein
VAVAGGYAEGAGAGVDWALRWLRAGTRIWYMAHVVPVRRCNLACTYCNEFDDVSEPVPWRRCCAGSITSGGWGPALSPSRVANRCWHPEFDQLIRANGNELPR